MFVDWAMGRGLCCLGVFVEERRELDRSLAGTCSWLVCAGCSKDLGYDCSSVAEIDSWLVSAGCSKDLDYDCSSLAIGS